MLGLLPGLLLLSLTGPSSGFDDNGTVVLTTSGPIRGKRLLAGSGTVTAFLGIPYAEPPVGALRFQKPLPHQAWSHVLEATSFGNACHQVLLTGLPEANVWTPKRPLSEDCLFLNVWVPHPQPNGTVPVLIWIHAGGFISGAASLDLYDGRFLATTENVIVASMNYRLGALGFLSLPPAAPGNAGLWDQHLALRWLRDNAAAFGGDPARFLLFGQSAGGSSVSFHLLSAGSRALFTRAALQSGAATAPWTWISLDEAKERGRRLGQLLGCADGDDTALVGCLQEKEPDEIPKHEFSVLRRKDLLAFPFVPTPDGDFLPDTPPRLLRAGHSQPMPILAGFTSNEGAYLLKFSPLNFSLENTSQIGWEELLQVVRLAMPEAPEEAVQIVARRYSQERQDEARYLWAMDQTTGDHLFVCPVAKVAGQEAEAGSPVYTYYFTHRIPGLSLPEWMGVPHGSEVPYLFGSLAFLWGANYTLTEAETGLRRRVMRYWAEFARSGNPTGSEGSQEQWPLYNSKEQNFVRISTEPPQTKGTSPTQHCGFLASLLKEKPSPTAETHRTADPSRKKEHEEEKEN
ncbi:acetylcholinesterase-like [Mauremys mutica]|uniref:acetylcholinesterase-like n=1 Tax=Mauremys mutica TaxID=74926 RepID=UPI001D1616B2|nr:acetylcholinesterase-like [Mauremys mutica]